MAKGYYPRGQDFDTVTKQEIFYEISFMKDLVASYPERAKVYFTDKVKFEKALKKMFDTKVRILDLIEWTIPKGVDFNKIATNLKVMEESKNSLMDIYLPFGE